QRKEEEARKQREEEERQREEEEARKQREERTLKRKSQAAENKEKRKKKLAFWWLQSRAIVNNNSKIIIVTILSFLAITLGTITFKSWKRGLQVFESQNFYGCKNHEGKIVFTADFDSIGEFSWGRAIAARNDSIFYISINGAMSFVDFQEKKQVESENIVEEINVEEIDDLNKLKTLLQNCSNPIFCQAIEQKMNKINMVQDFQSIKNSTEIEELENFMLKYPSSPFNDEIKQKISEFLKNIKSKNDDEFYNMIKTTNSINLYNEYKSKFPNGKHIKEVNSLIESFIVNQDEQAWNNATNLNTEYSYQNYLINFPKGKHIDEVSAKISQIYDSKALLAWEEVKNTSDIKKVKTFIKEYSKSIYVNSAENLIQRLEQKNTQIKTLIEDIEITNLLNKFPAKIESNELSNRLNELKEELEKTTVDEIEKRKLLIVKTQTLLNEIEVAKTEIKLSPVIQELEDGFVHLKASNYTLGCEGSDCNSDEQPAQEVSLKSIAVSKYEVTQNFYKLITGESPSYYLKCGNCPVENISYNEALE
ncbi:MAG TPA: hypothetical protein PK246_00740, partial [Saprospiraceae bacterium]|nr:hypothetical protein [Saprospiraceae bacterium]